MPGSELGTENTETAKQIWSQSSWNLESSKRDQY